MEPRDLVQSYLNQGFRPIFWPAIADHKGPRELGWTKKIYTIEDYHEGDRVGLITGTEVSPGKFLHDVDIDWEQGAPIAKALLPKTGFVFGRTNKTLSHCFYLLAESLPIFKYTDPTDKENPDDRKSLIELRGAKTNGDVGLQTMVPPSIWADKQGNKEPLIFISSELPSFIEPTSKLKQRVCLIAIGMLLAKHLGTNGFGHAPRLAWAGYLLRAGIPQDELIAMGEGISVVTNNHQIDDVRRVVESTAQRLLDPKQHIDGGPKLAKILGKHGAVILKCINEWLGRDSDFIRSKNGEIVKESHENISRALSMLDITLSHNLFSEKKYLQEQNGDPQVIDDDLRDKLWFRIDREYKFRATNAFFEKVLFNIAAENPFHPVRDYFKTLQWDGTNRIDTWLIDYAGAPDNAYVCAVGAIVLIAAVRRALHPGCKFDEMLVLESKQGTNKSTAIRTLCPHDDWFSDDLPLNVDSKQIIERTLGKWIIEASDLVGGRKADRDHLKSLLSRQFDGPARMAYAHISVERPRHFIIIGTTNSSTYLADSTGARRFWPIAVQRFDVERIRVDRDQLWAEAVVREAAGESIRLPEELWPVAEIQQESRREHDAWEDVIQEHLALLQPHGNGRYQVATSKIWDVLGIEVKQRDRAGAVRISDIMQRRGFTRTKIWADGITQAGYVSEKLMLELMTPSEDKGENESREGK